MVHKKSPPTKKPKKTGGDIKKQVMDRLKAEGVKDPVEDKENPKIKSSFVRWCVLEGNQLGDGLLYAKICRNKFVYNKASRVWLRWQGQHWELDRLDAAFGSVEAAVDVLINEKTKIDGEIDWALQKRDSDAVDALQKIQTVILEGSKNSGVILAG